MINDMEEKIKSWPIENGWYTEPETGKKIKLNDCTILGDDLKLGNYIEFNGYVIICNNVSLGNWVKLGNWVHLDNDVKIGNEVSLGNDVSLDRGVKLGDHVSLGYGVNLGHNVSLGDYVSLNNYTSLGDYTMVSNDIIVPMYCSADYYIHWFAPNTIKSGCIIKPFDWWQENVKRCAEEHEYTEQQQNDYATYVRHIIEWQEQMGDRVGWTKEVSK